MTPDYRMFVLRNEVLEVHVSSLGAIIQALWVTTKDGRQVDVALGHTDMSEYLTSGTYFGSVCGRAANRIAGATYTVDGKEGWDKKIWQDAVCPDHPEGTALKLILTSPDNDEGYPGTATASVTYSLKDTSLKAVFEAETDKVTPMNIVQHCYFNLGGHNSGDVLDHRLYINATHFTPKDKDNAGVIPTGKIVPVQGTAFDFSSAKAIGKDFAQLKGGYDHNFVLFGNDSNVKDIQLSRAKQRSELAAELSSPKTGITMKVSTTAPGLQVYTGGFLSDVKGKEGAVYQAAGGVCLETQGFPNAVNLSSFPSTLVRAGEHYYHEVNYEFSCI